MNKQNNATNNTQINGRTVYIVDGTRTPFLKARGKPGPFHASDLATQCARALLLRQPFTPDAIDEVILGCVAPGPDEANIARITALRIGCKETVPAWTVQRNCASGMQAIDSAAQNIAHGRAELVLAGGTEAMSHAPLLFNKSMVYWLAALNQQRTVAGKFRQLGRFRPAMLAPVIGLLRGLTDPVIGMSMGQTAEKLAWKFNISRLDMDKYAVRSHQRLSDAIEQHRLDEIIPIFSEQGKLFQQDDGVRPDSSTEKLAKLRPVFDRPVGNVTAGNSAQVTDGASVLLLASGEAVKKHQLPVLGKIVDSQWGALDPSEMGLGPVHAMAPLLNRHQLNTDDIDYWEINEAFAAQILACQKAWQSDEYCRQHFNMDNGFKAIPDDRLNIDGGGISLGHPVGASGARIILHLLHTLKNNHAHRGVASLCIGGGQGGAVLIEGVQQ